MGWRFLLLAGGVAGMAHGGNSADEIYKTGPETAAAASRRIVAGAVSRYSRKVTSTSEPAGPDAIPLLWIASGNVERPADLKGGTAGAVAFSRTEASPIVADTVSVPAWEAEYGDVQPSGQVVLFLGDAGQAHAVPSGQGEHDLVALIRDIVAIEGRAGDTQIEGWVGYLQSANTDAGREAALRSIVRLHAEWKRTAPALDRLLANAALDDQIRGFAFGIAVYGLTKNEWTHDQGAVADFLGHQLGNARSPRLAVSYLLSMKLALRYASEEAEREARAGLRARLAAALARNEAALSKSPEAAEQYRQIRAAYPGLL